MNNTENLANRMGDIEERLLNIEKLLLIMTPNKKNKSSPRHYSHKDIRNKNLSPRTLNFDETLPERPKTPTQPITSIDMYPQANLNALSQGYRTPPHGPPGPPDINRINMPTNLWNTTTGGKTKRTKKTKRSTKKKR